MLNVAQNVLWIVTALRVVLVTTTSVLIHVQDYVAKMHFAKLSIIIRLVIALTIM